MSELQLIIDSAAEALDDMRDELDPEEFDRRRQLLDQARAPRVAYLTRIRLAAEAATDPGKEGAAR